MALALYGMRLLWCAARREESMFYLALLAWITSIGVIFFGDPRYRYPAEPLLWICATPVVLQLWDRWTTRPRARLQIAGMVALILGLAVFDQPIYHVIQQVL